MYTCRGKCFQQRYCTYINHVEVYMYMYMYMYVDTGSYLCIATCKTGELTV